MDRSSPMAAARAGSLRDMHSDSTRRYARRLQERRQIPNLLAGGIRDDHPSHSYCVRPPAPGNPMLSSSSCDRLIFCRRLSVKRSACLFKKCAHVVGLENITAKEDASRPRRRNFADHIEGVFVRCMTASTEHQNRYRTFFNHCTH